MMAPPTDPYNMIPDVNDLMRYKQFVHNQYRDEENRKLQTHLQGEIKQLQMMKELRELEEQK